MEPSRELDALVAEKVMGYSIDPGLPQSFPGAHDWGTAFLYPPEWNAELGAWPSTRGRQADHEWDYVPHFSTNMTDAWKVVERLAEHGIVRVSNGDGDSYDCDFLPFAAGFTPFPCAAHAGGSDTPTESWPHAICLSALAAVKENE